MQNHKWGRPLNGQEKILPQGGLDHGSDIPNWGTEVDQGGAKALTRTPKVILHIIFQSPKVWSLMLQTRTRSSEVECSKVGHLPWQKKVQRSKSSSTLMRNWAVNLLCPQAWSSSSLGDSYPYYDGTYCFATAWPWRRPPKEFHPCCRG